ncbi:MAG: helix-turn-helix domain-containing protein [Flavobacteriales bacterium]
MSEKESNINKEEVFLKEVCENIVRIRKNKDMKQKTLADKMDMDDGSLRRIESGRTNPTLKIIYRVAKALDVEPWEILKV